MSSLDVAVLFDSTTNETKLLKCNIIAGYIIQGRTVAWITIEMISEP